MRIAPADSPVTNTGPALRDREAPEFQIPGPDPVMSQDIVEGRLLRGRMPSLTIAPEYIYCADILSMDKAGGVA